MEITPAIELGQIAKPQKIPGLIPTPKKSHVELPGVKNSLQYGEFPTKIRPGINRVDKKLTK